MKENRTCGPTRADHPTYALRRTARATREMGRPARRRDEPPNHELHRTKPAISRRRGIPIDCKVVITWDVESAGFAGELEGVGQADRVTRIKPCCSLRVSSTSDAVREISSRLTTSAELGPSLRLQPAISERAVRSRAPRSDHPRASA